MKNNIMSGHSSSAASPKNINKDNYNDNVILSTPQITNKARATSTTPLQQEQKQAHAITFQLRNYSQTKLIERSLHHFELLSNLVLPEMSSSSSQEQRQIETIDSLLECVVYKSNKKRRRELKDKVNSFNEGKRTSLPLQITEQTRVTYVYKKYHLAVVMDASDALTSSSLSGNKLPIDNIPTMLEAFLLSLIEKIRLPQLSVGTKVKEWVPELSVSVVAVYAATPSKNMLTESKEPPEKCNDSNVLVMSFDIRDESYVKTLINELEKWLFNDVEMHVAENFSYGFERASNLDRILEVAQNALDISSIDAKPIILLLSTCRLIDCTGIEKRLSSSVWRDLPLHVMDLDSFDTDQAVGHISSLENALSDDREPLCSIADTTGGCFLDAKLLKEMSRVYAGQVGSSRFREDSFFVSRRRTFSPNALQWYVLCSVSPLTPSVNPSACKVPIPESVRCRMVNILGDFRYPNNEKSLPGTSAEATIFELSNSGSQTHLSKIESRTTLVTYRLDQVDIKGIVRLRCQGGFKVKRYGATSILDPNKVNISFVLSTKTEVIIHYEISFERQPNETSSIGSASIKIVLDGPDSFVSLIKRFSLSNAPLTLFPNESLLQSAALDVSTFLRNLRNDDYIQALLVRKKDTIVTERFLGCIDALTPIQLQSHFYIETFDLIYTGNAISRNGESLTDFKTNVIASIKSLSAKTHSVIDGSIYISPFSSTSSEFLSYALVSIAENDHVSMLLTITTSIFATNPSTRKLFVRRVESILESLDSCVVLPRAASKYILLIGDRCERSSFLKRSVRDLFFDCGTWRLEDDHELWPLLFRRRTEIGDFLLFDKDQGRSVFGKFIDNRNNPTFRSHERDGELRMVIYEILETTSSSVVVNLLMDYASGMFQPELAEQKSRHNLFGSIYKTVKRRDVECSLALFSRSRLLSLFENTTLTVNGSLASDIERLLAYSVETKCALRFFRSGAGPANTILLSSSIDFILSYDKEVRVSRICVDETTKIGDFLSGSWFVVEHSQSDVLTIVYLSHQTELTRSTENDSTVYSNLSFFTFGISDLYSTKADIDEDDVDDDTLNTKLYDEMIERLAQDISDEHNRNFARVTYFILRDQSSNEYGSPVKIDPDDFRTAYKQCEEKLVTENFVSHNYMDVSRDAGTLSLVMKSLLKEVGIDDGKIFYFPTPPNEEEFIKNIEESANVKARKIKSLSEGIVREVEGAMQIHEESSSDNGSTFSYNDGESSYVLADYTMMMSQHSEFSESWTKNHVKYERLPPPIFVKVCLNGKAASIQDVIDEKSGTQVSVYCTTFSDEQSELHHAFATAFRMKITAIVAAQQLEHLRSLDVSLSRHDLTVVLKCISQADVVTSSSVKLKTFIPKHDLLDTPTQTTINTNDFESAYELFCDQLLLGTLIEVRRASQWSFCVTSFKKSVDYWGFLHLDPLRGIVSIHVYHPSGWEAASTIAKDLEEKILKINFRVNLKRMFEALHQTKNASSLLTVEEATPVKEEKGYADIKQRFSCPVVFRQSFPIHQRINASNAVISLESSVLHPFAVSNRRGVFVYKDGNENIFLMMLTSHISSGKEERAEEVTLVVRGIEYPASDITEQLCRLLSKKLTALALDSLSSLLAKNPSLNLKSTDIQFIEQFKDAHNSVEYDEKHLIPNYPRYKDFSFPSSALDPMIILLYFRQNICGSSYFHRLQVQQQSRSSPSVNRLSEGQEADDISSSRHQTVDVLFDSERFDLFFNNSPTPLNPGIQAVSTLTSKGESFARQVGSGIAIIHFEFFVDGSSKVPIESGVLSLAEDTLIEQELLHQSMRFSVGQEGRHTLRVKIINTTCNVNVLYEWIELTLNQAHISWYIENYIKLIRSKSEEAETSLETVSKNIFASYRMLEKYLESAYCLPSLAVKKLVVKSNLNAVSIPSLVVKVLLSIMTSLGKNVNEVVQKISITRLNNCTKNHLFLKEYSSDPLKYNLVDESGFTFNEDPTISPKYISSYGLSSSSNMPHNLLFKEVVVEDPQLGDDEKEFCRVLRDLKKKQPSIFTRNLFFLLSISRNRFELYVYNLHPEIFQALQTRLSSLMNEHLWREKQSARLKKVSALKTILPSTFFAIQSDTVDGNKKIIGTQDRDEPAISASSNEKASHEKESGQNLRRSRFRNVSIRKPRLIGASVEGAAMQAVLASRERASQRGSFTTRASNKSKRPSLSGSGTSSKTDKVAKQSTLKGSSTSKNVENREEPRSKKSENNAQKLSHHGVQYDHNIIDNVEVLQKRLHCEDEFTDLICTDSKTIRQLFSMSTNVFYGSQELLSYVVGSLSAASLFDRQSSSHFDPFLDYTRRILINRFSPIKIYDEIGATKNSLYLKKTLFTKKDSGCTALIELSTYEDGNSISSACIRIQKFLFGSAKNFERSSMWKKNTRQQNHEREAINRFLNVVRKVVDIESLVYDFDCYSLLKFSTKNSKMSNEAVALARSLERTFPINRVKQIKNAHHRITMKPINLFTIEGQQFSKIVTPKAAFRFACSRASSYNLSDTGRGKDKALVGFLPQMNERASFILVPTKDETTFQLFILFCDTDITHLDKNIILEHSRVAMPRYQYFLFRAEKFVCSILLDAAKRVWSEYLWNGFSDDSSSTRKLGLDDLCQLCELSHRTNIQTILDDDSVSNLFFDPTLGVQWSQAIEEMDKDHTHFFSSFQANIPDRQSTVYLYYIVGNSDYESYLIIELSNDDDDQQTALSLKDMIILTKKDFQTETTSLISPLKEAAAGEKEVENLVNWFLQWLWNAPLC